MEVVCLNLKQNRIKSNLKIKGICDYLNISRTTYYLMEAGRRKITDQEEDKLNTLFDGVKINEINIKG